MGDNIVYKIIKKHIVDGEAVAGSSIGIKIDQTLTQDSTGTMTYLQLEAMGIDKVKTKRSVAFVDHNMLQQGFENADDHKYIQTVADKYGVYFSKPGNGICHQVFLERFSTPEDYIHRIGRTGRAGEEGYTCAFIDPKNERMLSEIETAIESKINRRIIEL